MLFKELNKEERQGKERLLKVHLGMLIKVECSLIKEKRNKLVIENGRKRKI